MAYYDLMPEAEFIQNTVGAILYLATGAMAIDTYRELPKSELRNVGLALGALSLVNSAAYAVDAFFAFKNKRGLILPNMQCSGTTKESARYSSDVRCVTPASPKRGTAEFRQLYLAAEDR
ncbi:unnamed protein product [Notodromas monacha]|uniref:Uncharacterized protein n=1 Tax=Notodromas monacha TaxID=399045 RepID=A0A7R9G7W8_9CRUS|nr:unnamed protein product [Notodromas monacha]CAG0912650.1 unnamed protein product [Notodromas monacha]